MDGIVLFLILINITILLGMCIYFFFRKKPEPTPSSKTFVPSMIRDTLQPALGINNPDVHVLNVNGRYYMTTTSTGVDNTGTVLGLPLHVSDDTKTWTLARYIFTSNASGIFNISGENFCSVWAPQIFQTDKGFMMTFTAKWLSNTTNCSTGPVINDRLYLGVYFAQSSTIDGDYQLIKPFPGQNQPCGKIAYSIYTFDPNRSPCGFNCEYNMSLDSHQWQDPDTKDWWCAYSWYTTQPNDSFPGENISIVRMNPNEISQPMCNFIPIPIYAGSLLQKQIQYECKKYLSPDRCDYTIRWNTGRHNESMPNNNIIEGAGLMKRKGWVYLFFSTSAWDSPNYNISWMAIKKDIPDDMERFNYAVPFDNQTKIGGIFIPPTKVNGVAHNFGHGTAFPVTYGSDLKWKYAMHHMSQTDCDIKGWCGRDVYIVDIVFEDRYDGLGDIWIKPVDLTPNS